VARSPAAPTVASSGVPAPRRIAAVAACLAVALGPGVARAQTGAGDDQYADPFSEQPQPAPKPKTPVQPVPHQQIPSQTQTQAQRQAGTSPPAPMGSAAQSGELPRTGLNLVPLALGGVALVAAGLALRRRAGHGRD
jgi:LPXTG-motif cell wall-anchored protein